jgi:hypothetical protein
MLVRGLATVAAIACLSLHAATPDSFDLNARKARLPWIWQAPHPQPLPPIRGKMPSTDIDLFIRFRLEQADLTPAPPVSDSAWLRRAHFAITGLPPTREALHAFRNDPSPDRHQRTVDALLASPHFGERWARHWMDLMRYAESRGHEFDFTIPNAWHYRDYLIRAFNHDLPYDRLVAEHIAGDLLEPRLDPATGAHESILATGWAFLGEEPHSPVDLLQDECERIDNKIDVFSKAFLGLTIACARCHDHKFDALTQRDYYALSGFLLGSGYRQARFDTLVEHQKIGSQLDDLRRRHREGLAADAAARLRPGIEELASRLLQAASPNASTNWSQHLQTASDDPSNPLHLFARLSREPSISDPTQFTLLLTRFSVPHPTPSAARLVADYTRPNDTPWITDGPGFGPRPLGPGESLPGGTETESSLRILPHGGAAWDGFWNRLALTPGNEADTGSLGASQRAGRTLRTPSFILGSGRIHYLIRGRARVYAAVDSHITIAGPLHGGLLANFNVGTRTAWVTHNLTDYAGHRTHIEFTPDAQGPLEVLQVVEADHPPGLPPHLSWRPTGNPSSLAELAATFASDCSQAADALARNELNRHPSLAPLCDWMLQNAPLLGIDTQTPTPASDAWSLERDSLARTVRWDSRTAVAWLDGTGVDTPVLIRGKPGRNGESAPRALPAAFGLPSVETQISSGRLELSRQLTDPANPLVARVLVNRVWHHLFGRGIVPTTDNFGFLGERPSHPELLDHLAWHFVHTDHWSLKRLIRRLVLTDAFATGSDTPTAAADSIDPANLLWHRIPVRRLDGESIRDAILSVAGRLDPSPGGPPVPVHLTEFTQGRGRPDRDGPLDGAGRRSLYTAIRRNFMPPLLVAFDFPTPFSSMGRRNRTNVPAQSLALMNDPFVHQQARVWADRLQREIPEATDDARIVWLFESAFARSPRPDETRACQEALTELRELHLEPGAVWADLCHALLNTSEFIYIP